MSEVYKLSTDCLSSSSYNVTVPTSGGAKGWPSGACAPAPSVNPCAPAGKPSSFHSVMQHQFFSLHSTIFHTNRGQLFAAHGTRRRDFESKSSKIFPGMTPPDPLCKRGYPILTNACDESTPVRPSCPVRSYGAPVVTQQEYFWHRHWF